MKCSLCSDLKGSIVYALNRADKKWQWVHIVCANYMTGIWFAHKEARNAADIVEIVNDTSLLEGRVPPMLKTLTCSICRKSPKQHPGACIQCDYKDCTVSFHVRCAIKKRIIQDWDRMND